MINEKQDVILPWVELQDLLMYFHTIGDEKAETMLRNLTPVRSGGVVTNITGESIVRAWIDEDVRKRPGYKGWYSLMSNEDEDDLAKRIGLALQSTAPQPKARGVVLSRVKRFNIGTESGIIQHPDGYWVRFSDLAHLQQAPQWVGEWIPVTERLPEYNTEVLITNGKEIQVGSRSREWSEKREAFYPDDFDMDLLGPDKKVTYWQPLPPAPVKVNDHD